MNRRAIVTLVGGIYSLIVVGSGDVAIGMLLGFMFGVLFAWARTKKEVRSR